MPLPRVPVFVAMTLCAALTTAATPTPLERTVERLHASGLNGTVLAGSMAGITTERHLGLARRASCAAVDAHTVWPWASVSKQVTAILIMQEVERGTLVLDAPLATALPDFKGPSAARLTLRHLLRHTAGLPNPEDTPLRGAFPAFYTETGQAIGARARAAGICAGPVKAAPGAGFSYNNCDYLLLEAVLERVTGLSYRELIAERLARPLQLRSLRVASDSLSDWGTTVDGHDKGERIAGANLATLGAGGALIGTARDLFTLDQAILSGKLLSASATAELNKGDPALGYVALGAWSYSASLDGCSKPVQLIERRGAFGGVQVRNVIAPELGQALIVFTNEDSFPFGEVWQRKGASHQLLSAALCPAPATAPVAP